MYSVLKDGQIINKDDLIDRFSINERTFYRYIKEIRNFIYEEGVNTNIDLIDEDIIFDKYRNVYYRFACPQTEVDSKDSYLEITRYGKKLFTIVILDKDLNIIGEKLFPEFTYVPTAHLIRKDGLYISCSHFKNPNYSDDVLCFQKIKLISNL